MGLFLKGAEIIATHSSLFLNRVLISLIYPIFPSFPSSQVGPAQMMSL